MPTNLITGTTENLIQEVMNSLLYMQANLDEVQKVYFGGGASGAISALADGDPVTVSTKLTKAQLVSGITFVENFQNFLGNSAVTQADYFTTLVTLLNGNDEAAGVIHTAVETVGNDLKDLASTSLGLFQKCKVILDLYFDNQINSLISAIDTSRIVFGASVTAAKFSTGITLIEQFKNFINNAVVAQADYMSTVSNWKAEN